MVIPLRGRKKRGKVGDDIGVLTGFTRVNKGGKPKINQLEVRHVIFLAGDGYVCFADVPVEEPLAVEIGNYIRDLKEGQLDVGQGDGKGGVPSLDRFTSILG